jgi:peptide/nickel transport system substrate-binding protein
MNRTSSSRRLRRPLAFLLALAFTAACGGGGGADGDPGAGSATEPPAEGEPAAGGHMVIAVEAEVDGFDPTTNRLPVAGLSFAHAIYDTLAVLDENDEPVPYLAESIEPNDDHTVWTVTLRDGVTFHNGDPLDAEAVVLNLESHRESPLTGPAIDGVESVELVDELTLRIHLDSSWVIFPSVLTAQIGFVAAPAMLDYPDGSRNPIGTGPFRFEDWEPGSRLRLTRNDDYWRADEGLPYLDSVEFRPIAEAQSRNDALLSGEVHLIHTSAGQSIHQLRQAGDEVSVLEPDSGAAEENFILMNTMVEPFDNVHARRALSLAVDREQYSQVIDQGVTEPADSPFSGQSDLPEPDGGYQHFDIEQARDEVDAYRADTGRDLEFNLAHANTAVVSRAVQLLQEMWRDAGIEVSLTPTEQSQFINDFILGDFQAGLWRQHGAPTPDMEFVWWDINNANEVGVPSLNFGRYRNDDLQDILEGARGVVDADERARMYGDVVQIFADDVPFAYLTRTQWAYAYAPDVGGISTQPPQPGGDGEVGEPLGGLIRVVGLYFADGDAPQQ